MSKPQDLRPYRPCVGMIIFNDEGLVWLGHRHHTDPGNTFVWQFPQGGIDPGETSEYAAIREAEEETGISVQHLVPLGQTRAPLYYDYPADISKNPRTVKWRGQKQDWFAVRFKGKASDVNLNAHYPPEFSKWKWGHLSDTPDLIVPFKRKVYEQLVIEFAPYARPVN